MGMGGNVGTQTNTIIVRGIATGHVNLEEVSKVLFKELSVGMTLGLVYGFLLGFLAYFHFVDYPAHFMLGIVVGISIFISMSVACLAASILPILLKKLDIDPAISAGPFVTTFIDIVGVSSYFLIAMTYLPK